MANKQLPVIKDGVVQSNPADTTAIFRKLGADKMKFQDVSEDLRTNNSPVASQNLTSSSREFTMSQVGGINYPTPSGQLLTCGIPYDCEIVRAWVTTDASGNTAPTDTDYNTIRLLYRRSDETELRYNELQSVPTKIRDVTATFIEIDGPFNYQLQEGGNVSLSIVPVGTGMTTHTGEWALHLLVSPL